MHTVFCTITQVLISSTCSPLSCLSFMISSHHSSCADLRLLVIIHQDVDGWRRIPGTRGNWSPRWINYFLGCLSKKILLQHCTLKSILCKCITQCFRIQNFWGIFKNYLLFLPLLLVPHTSPPINPYPSRSYKTQSREGREAGQVGVRRGRGEEEGGRRRDVKGQ